MFFFFFSFLCVIGNKKNFCVRKPHHKNQKNMTKKLINNHRLVIIIQHLSTMRATFSIMVFIRCLQLDETNETSRKMLLIFSSWTTPILKQKNTQISFRNKHFDLLLHILIHYPSHSFPRKLFDIHEYPKKN